MVKTTLLSRLLQGADRRSIGKSNQVAARILRNPHGFAELIECLWSDDPIVRMRAADATEKICARRPDLLQPFKAELLGLAEETMQAELRWHLAMMLPRLSLSRAERLRTRRVLQRYMDDGSSIVKTWAMNGLAELAKGDSGAEAEILDFIERTLRTGTPAMRARARQLLKVFRRK
jgi:hypothetical protein